MKLKSAITISIIAVLFALFATKTFFFRIDLTEEKRYTISQNSKNLLKNIDKPLKINIFIGQADANIAKLKIAVNDILDEFSVYSSKLLNYKYINPSKASSEKERLKNYEELENRGFSPITISMRDSQGKISQQIIFPWAEIIAENDTMPVCLMQSTGRFSSEESVNAAIENLEYQFIDAIRILTQKDFQKIAFLEGHGELSEIDTYFAQETLSRYFQVDRGVLGNDAAVLSDYKAIIIAKPTEKFSETDKFIIDQYIMNGGKTLWLLDAVQISDEELSKSGASPAISLDLNLLDMLFRYGVRIEPSVVQDRQCISRRINVSLPSEPAHFEPEQWTYSPLLMANPYHPITKNLMPVKADYPSFLSQVSTENGIKMEVLLQTSNSSRADMTPTNIALKNLVKQKNEEYFTTSYIPIAAAMEGEFESVFAHRQTPQNLQNLLPRKNKSVKNRMIVAADGDIIRNEIERSQQGGIGILPLGLDRLTGQVYGNNNFIINALQYLTEDEKWIELRNRTIRLRFLNKTAITSYRTFYQLINVAVPLLLLTLFGIIFFSCRIYNNKKNRHIGISNN
jgi:ABC-2 type transport system permease protein